MSTITSIYMSGDGNLELLKFDNGDMIFMFHDIVDDFVVDPKEQKQVADAIYAELGLGWLPYPENKPEKSGTYFVTISPNSCVPLPRVVRRDFYNCDTDKWRDFESADIVAFIKDVQPYSKRKQRQP